MQLYEKCSGQAINKDKLSSAMFRKDTNDTATSNFMDMSEMGQTEAKGKYLGLPVHMGRSEAEEITLVIMGNK
jgi:hypothetical protein